MSIGENIKKIRKEKGLTQKQLGNKLGISQAAIGQFENSSNLKIDTIQKIADALETPMILFVEDDLLDVATWIDGSAEQDLIDKKFNEIMNNTEISIDEKKRKTEELLTQLEIMEDYHIDNVNHAIEYRINQIVKQLNHIGKEKALEHVEMLSKIPEYKKDNN